MSYQLLVVLVFTLVGIAFVAATIGILGRLVRPRVRSLAEPSKEETYECGEPAVGSSWVRFNSRFYTLALVFLVFDVEVALLYPWALVFRPLREAGLGLFVALEALLFLAILGAGFVYCWAKGDLDWVKSVAAPDPARSEPERAGSRIEEPGIQEPAIQETLRP